MTLEDNGVGPIILQEPVAVCTDDTAASLQDRTMKKGEWVVLPQAISLYCQNRLSVHDGRVYIHDQSKDIQI